MREISEFKKLENHPQKAHKHGSGEQQLISVNSSTSRVILIYKWKTVKLEIEDISWNLDVL